MNTVPSVASGAWVPSRVAWPSIHAEQRLMRQTGMDDAPVASSTTGSSSSPTHTPLSPLLSCSCVAVLNFRIDRGAVATIADRAAGHSSGHRAEHAAGAAQVLVGGEDFGGRGRRETEMGPCASGDRWGALRNTTS